jgi:predicted ATP-grasp superfamily ATP-dependent carboligase
LRILVYEHASGGGFAEEPLPQGVLAEGFAMLRSLVSDFRAAGHEVATLLDSRVAALSPPLDTQRIVPVSSRQEANEELLNIAASMDATYVIAPETDKALETLVRSLEHRDAMLLNCPARAIAEVADKAVLHEHLRKLDVPTPDTLFFSAWNENAEIKRVVSDKLGFPVVFKPLDGVSCSGLSVVHSEREVAGAVGKLQRESDGKRFVAQKLINGVAASVCIIATSKGARAVSLNRQDVRLRAPSAVSSYNGGLVPFDSPLRREAFAVAEKVVKSFQKLKGFVGVDLVLTEAEPVVLEVNPRLTMSYVGLKKVARRNMAQAIVDTVLHQKSPDETQTSGCAYFSKVMVHDVAADAFREACRMSEVVSPPFPVAGDGSACAILLSHGTTENEAMTRFGEAKKRFLDIMDGGAQSW